jgi:NCS1 nucleoside transporter family
MSDKTTKPSTLEVHHVDVISPKDRHGTARDLFPVWFSANLNVGNAFFGALAVIVGNNLFWAIVAVVLGNIAGAVFMAFHSIQGAKLGVPQLIQSRGQFGFYGALLPVALAAFLYLGFFATTAVIGGQALTAALPVVDLPLSIVVVALVSLALALVGYKAIHLAAKWAMWPLAVAVVVVTVALILHGGFDLAIGTFEVGPFLTAFGLIASFLLTYAPYVSDYSRYLPEETKANSAFGWTFSGAFLGTTWTMLLGVLLAAQFNPDDTMASIGELFGGGWLAAVILIVTAVAIGGNNALNLYGSMLNLITGVTSFKQVNPSAAARIWMLLPTFLLGLLIAITASADFSANVSNFLSFLLLGFVPWGAVNLVDYYWVRRGDYNVSDFFNSRGVYYKDRATWTRFGVNWQAMISYFVGVGFALPFVNNGWLQGPGAVALGNADLAWIPGLLVTGALYLLLSRNNRRTTQKVGD